MGNSACCKAKKKDIDLPQPPDGNKIIENDQKNPEEVNIKFLY
jgi:hypothetical protein